MFKSVAFTILLLGLVVVACVLAHDEPRNTQSSSDEQSSGDKQSYKEQSSGGNKQNEGTGQQSGDKQQSSEEQEQGKRQSDKQQSEQQNGETEQQSSKQQSSGKQQGSKQQQQQQGDQQSDKLSVSSSHVDFKAIFKLLMIDDCNQNCAEPLMNAIQNSMDMMNVTRGMRNVCAGYKHLFTCQKTNKCPVTSMPVNVALSGIEQMCEPQTQKTIEKEAKCVDPIADKIAQGCENKCKFIKNLATFSHTPAVQKGADGLSAIGSLGGVCEGFQCFYRCFREQASGRCDNVGTLITKIALHPLYTLADDVDKLGPQATTMIVQKVPQSCAQLTTKESLDMIAGKSPDSSAQTQ